MLRHPSRQHCNHSGRIASTLRWLYPSSPHPYPLFVLLFFCCRHVVQRKNSPPVTERPGWISARADDGSQLSGLSGSSSKPPPPHCCNGLDKDGRCFPRTTKCNSACSPCSLLKDKSWAWHEPLCAQEETSQSGCPCLFLRWN